MDKFEKECLCNDIETNIDKMEYIAEKIIQEYDLDKGAIMDRSEALKFANNRDNIGMEMEILCDYIRNIRNGIAALGESLGI